MESTQDPTQYFEDITTENQAEAQPAKKGAPQRRGFYSSYTHFITIPLLGEEIKAKFLALDREIIGKVEEENRECIRFQSPDLFHISLAMLNLRNETMKKAATEALAKSQEGIKAILKDNPFKINLGGLEAFMDKKSSKNSLPKLLYIKLGKDADTSILDKISNCIIRAMMEKEVIDADDLPALNLVYDHTKSVFRPEAYHATFMRVKNTPERKYDATPLIEYTKDRQFDEYEVKRIDISTRFEFGDDKFYKSLATLNL